MSVPNAVFRDGTRIRAECADYDVEGTLVGDHDDLDGRITVREDDGEVVVLNAWLWMVDVVNPSPPPTGHPGKAIKASGRDGA